MKYDEIIEYLKSLPPFVPVKKENGELLFDLNTVSELARRFDDPQGKLKCVHIAGTNGKGSVSEFLSQILIESGYRVGTFTSPYLSDIREQVKVDGEMISKEDFSEIFGSVLSAAEDMRQESLNAGKDGHPTVRYKAPSEFEMAVVAAFLFFCHRKCDICIIEAGLGGEHDATNIIRDPLLCLFTSISKDHTAVLGDSLESIASVKAGIIKPGCECISVEQKDEVRDILKKRSEDKDVAFYTFHKPLLSEVSLSGICFEGEFSGNRQEFRLGVSGSYQAENAYMAIKAAERLRLKGFDNIGLEAIRNGLLTVKRPGRFDVLCHEPLVIADGSHNEGGVKALLESLKELFPDRFGAGKGFVFIAGIMADKDYKELLMPLKDHIYKVYTVTPDNVRALPAVELADIFSGLGADAQSTETVREALTLAMEKSVMNDMPVIVFGSLYYLGELIEVAHSLTGQK